MAFKGDDSTLSLATTVTLALAVAAMVFVKNPLQSSRPPGSITGLHKATGELKVPARLWEDPFAAVEKAVEAQRQISVQIMADDKKIGLVKATVAQEQQGDDGLKVLQDKILEIGSQSILALVVMTQGGLSVEDGEVRIRDRYAVGAALEAGCFTPDKGESLSYFRWKFPEKSSELVPPQYTPYEWYSRNEVGACHSLSESPDKYRHVVVLWVKAQEGEDKLLARISELVSKFPMLARLVGPRTSSEFRSILKEIQKEYSRRPRYWGVLMFDAKERYRWQQLHKNIPVYSPWATAMPSLLFHGLTNGPVCRNHAECENVLKQLLGKVGMDLSYRVTSDGVLFESVLSELERRQVAIGQDRIVLIGEWDSFYARALPMTFTAAAHRHVQNSRNAKCKPDQALSRTGEQGSSGQFCMSVEEGIEQVFAKPLLMEELNIVQYSYLSGLDGETAEEQAKRTKSREEDKGKDRDKGEGKASFRDIASYERPEGQAQLDYVRRLVARMKSDSSQERAGKGRGGKVKAIGILGRDPYDALLILQAVREEFPNALFFATDLDARYFHEDEQKWTRNLIVASQFGLQLASPLQQSIPPFRSSLQTSTFFAVQQAIGAVESMPQNESIPPRLFEIGRHGAVDLSLHRPNETSPTIHSARLDVDKTGKFDPPPSIGLLWIVGLTLGFLALWGYGRLWNWMTARDEPDPAKRRLELMPRSAWVAIPVVMALVLTCQIVHLETYAGEEPFSWTDGVSIWPTEALRFLAICLCLFFLLKARADSVYNIDEITQAFSTHLSPRPTGLGWRDKLKGFWSDLDWMFHGSKQHYPGDAKDLWGRYRRAHEWPPRAGRIALGLLAYLFLLLPLVWVMNEGEFRLHVPCRGTFSCRLDHMFVAVSVLLFLTLNLATLDAVILCTKWIQELPSAATQMNSMEKIRLIVERSTVVNRRILHPFIILFLLIGARSHYFDNWDFPPVLILALTVNSLVAIASASLLYLTAVGAKRRILTLLQLQLDKTAPSTDQTAASGRQVGSADQRSWDEAVRLLIKDIDSIQQGAFVPFYQQPMVQATLVAALAFLQYWYLGQ